MHQSIAEPSFELEGLEPRRLLAAAIVITHGGTYTGTWESDKHGVPAVTIATSDPVIIENSIIRSRDGLIETSVGHTKVIVRRTTGYALNPNVAGESAGAFFSADFFDSAELADNTLIGTSGIRLQNYRGNSTAGQTIKILRNTARNIDGRKSNGTGGYQTFNTRTRISDGHREDGFDHASFVQLDKVIAVPGIEVAWNQVVNEPGNSRVEDNINIFNSSGTAASPILIHDNFIDGAYTIQPWQASRADATWRYDWSYSGGGILLGDGKGPNPANDSAFVHAYNNSVVRTTNYGIAIASGHDNVFYNNRVVSCGKLADGLVIVAQNTGYYIWDSYHLGPTRFFKNSAHDNVSGWMNAKGRNDWWAPNATSFTKNAHLSGTLSMAVEDAEKARWQARYLEAFPPPGNIGGIIFGDADVNGVRGASEVGISRVSVFLDTNRNGTRDAGEPITTTSSTGRYTFSSLRAGAYRVCIVPPSGWRATVGTGTTVTAQAGKTVTRYFGMTHHILITGTVFMDADVDGTRDAAEPPLSNWVVFVDNNKNGLIDSGEASAITDASGQYSFKHLLPGTYQICAARSFAYRLTTPIAVYHLVSANSGGISSGNDFGEKRKRRR